MHINYCGNAFDKPFKHIVIKDFVPLDYIYAINQEWPPETAEEWKKENAKYSIKWGSRSATPTADKIIQTIDPKKIGEIVDIDGLFADPSLFGAGLHCVPRGGKLNMHVDFNQHPEGWHRRVNLLLYLNLGWVESWGGELSLGKDQSVKIPPLAGTCAIFETTENSWHGHPEPLNCPEGIQRRSLALYFYTKEPPQQKAHSTIYIK